MSKRTFAGAVLVTMLSAGALAAQDFGFTAPGRSLARPDHVSIGLLRPTFFGPDAPDAQGTLGLLAAIHSSQQLRPGVNVEVGVGVARRGAEEKSASYSTTTRTTNIEAPVLVRLGGMPDGTFGLPQIITLAGGVQADVTLSCKQTMKSSGYSSSAKCTDESTFDLAAMIGGGVVVNAAGRPIGIDVFFTNGFMKVFKNYKVYNRSLDVRARVPLKAITKKSS